MITMAAGFSISIVDCGSDPSGKDGQNFVTFNPSVVKKAIFSSSRLSGVTNMILSDVPNILFTSAKYTFLAFSVSGKKLTKPVLSLPKPKYVLGPAGAIM